jgi:hypothetical protein
MWRIALLLFSSCLAKNTPESQECHWPSEWDKGMELEINGGGGMVPEWWKIKVKEDIAIYQYNFQHHLSEVSVKLSKTDLDSIASLIRFAKPEKIKMKKHSVIYDKGSTHLMLHYNQCRLSIGESATESFNEKDGENFWKLISMVHRMIDREGEKKKLNLGVEVECARNNGYWAHLQVNFLELGTMDCAHTSRIKTTRVFPGQHTIFSYVFKSKDGSHASGERIWQGESFSFSIHKDTMVKFVLKDSLLVLRRK